MPELQMPREDEEVSSGQWVDQQFEPVGLGGEWVSSELRLRGAWNAKSSAHIPLCTKQESPKAFTTTGSSLAQGSAIFPLLWTIAFPI